MVRCSPASCSLWEQNCPSGQKCTPSQGWSWNECVPLDPEPGAPGQPCTVEDAPGNGGDSCDLASMCWDVDPQTHVGECFLRCTGGPSDPVCPDGTTCVLSNHDALILCLPTCHPLAQDCPDGEACLSSGGDSEPFACIAEYSGDEGQVFDSCDYANDCDPGLLCASPEAAVECDPIANGCCLPFCDTEQPVACPGAMQTCQPWFEVGAAPAGYEHVGMCTLPL
ncbi:ribulose phosphate epimerase [Nannocystis sp. ILAH1]|uniref:ribulose phosphate epimerase n=1 Tax=unclassified Nannocystis TaxID=2627009 RepID=UPI00226F61FC|nr:MULTISPECIES: ribulose phosphate epimerase [unclassified Nannocystis]MCY0988746.1 ribulose phosphate epimerase [Nannocystis sp. ILAH1]MCY1072522.1 ribulose phosphate epimerase [Nannocystis sp. RBIL2]